MGCVSVVWRRTPTDRSFLRDPPGNNTSTSAEPIQGMKPKSRVSRRFTSTRSAKAGRAQWRTVLGLSAMGVGVVSPALRDAVRLAVDLPILKSVGAFGDVVGGLEGIRDVFDWLWHGIGSGAAAVIGTVTEVFHAFSPLVATAAVVLLLGALRSLIAQGATHLNLAYLEKHLATIPPDTQVQRSSGVDGAHFYMGPNAVIASPERLWVEVRMMSWSCQVHPMLLTRRFSRVEVAGATVHDVRLFARAARRVWLSATERHLVAAVIARARDLYEWPDSSGDGGDDGPDNQSTPTAPPSTWADQASRRTL